MNKQIAQMINAIEGVEPIQAGFKTQNWASNQVEKINMRLQQVQHHAAYRVMKKGGHRIAQDFAALCAKDHLLNGHSAARAIHLATVDGMTINEMVSLSDIQDALEHAPKIKTDSKNT